MDSRVLRIAEKGAFKGTVGTTSPRSTAISG